MGREFGRLDDAHHLVELPLRQKLMEIGSEFVDFIDVATADGEDIGDVVVTGFVVFGQNADAVACVLVHV